MNHYEPGQRYKLGDGTPVVVVRGCDVPEAFVREWCRVKGYKYVPSSTIINLYAVGALMDGKWGLYAPPPWDPWDSGSCYVTGDRSELCCTVVPEKYMRPEVNEFGVVSP